ncbi:MAG: hypothetical protein QM660_10920 [Dysgonomonas sp.]
MYIENKIDLEISVVNEIKNAIESCRKEYARKGLFIPQAYIKIEFVFNDGSGGFKTIQI